jgi:hypothetical protein
VNNLQDAVEALEAKVGVDGSAETDSLDYRVDALENAGGGGGPYPQAYLRAANRISNIDINMATGDSVGFGSGNLVGSCFTAPIDLTVTTIRWANSAGATESTSGSGWALYSVDSSDNMTRLATVTGTTIFTGTGVKTATFGDSVNLVKGGRYAIAGLHVQGFGNPTLCGHGNSATSALLTNVAPRSQFLLQSQTSFPSSISASSLTTAEQNIFYAELY